MRPACVRLVLLLAPLACSRSGPVAETVKRPPCLDQNRSLIPAENTLQGDAAWTTGKEITAHELEGFAGSTTASAGDSVPVYVSTDSPHTVSWVVYRLGWYAGLGARRMESGGPLSIASQPACPMDPNTGLIKCDWSVAFTLDVSAHWLSGLYAIKLTRDDGYVRYIPLVVADTRCADIVLQSSIATSQAYNDWGGSSLYHDFSGTLRNGKAAIVGFDRPYLLRRGLAQELDDEV